MAGHFPFETVWRSAGRGEVGSIPPATGARLGVRFIEGLSRVIGADHPSRASKVPLSRLFGASMTAQPCVVHPSTL